MTAPLQDAPGAPGIPPRWTSSAKSAVGTAAGARSRVWFTVSHGIVNEVYYPRVDQANTRDLGFLVSEGDSFFSEEKRHARSEISALVPGVPAFRLTNTCLQGRYRLLKTIITDPQRDVLLQRVRFEALRGRRADYRLFALLAPHIANHGYGNNGWIGDYKGTPMLFARRGDTALALACSAPFRAMSCGYVGSSDGWQDVSAHKRMTWFYPRALDGNIALTGEIDLQACDGEFVLALAFGGNTAEAGQRALAALLQVFDRVAEEYVRGWQEFQDRCLDFGKPAPGCVDLCRTSATVLKIHEAKRFPGATIASLSVPWGFAKGDNDLGGYHLVWPRDLVETAGGLLAAGAQEDARRVLFFLQTTQEADGHWLQNMWLDGTPYWSGIQMDETAFPILLADLAGREKALEPQDMARLWPMVRRAAGFLVRNGPVTQQDRWEEDPGYSPFTLAAEIAALLAAADMAEHNREPRVAAFLRETADVWNENIERWIYVSGTELARETGVEGYYVRVAPAEVADAASPRHGFVPIKNRPPGQSSAPAEGIVSPDALALVRFGLRAPDDRRILDTVRVIDRLLKADTPSGPVWHRYNNDGYGEHEDGSPFDGTGIGRGWPLLAGERAHYELAAGRREEAGKLLQALESFANEGGLISEQVWDAPDIPDKELFFGKPSGSAMPLVWAHAEYIKLRRSLKEGSVFDMPPQTVRRYQAQKAPSPYAAWRFNHKCRTLPAGKLLRLEVLEPALVHWSVDGWRTTRDTPTRDTGLGVHLADLPTEKLPAGTALIFTFHWLAAGRWEGTNFEVAIAP